MNKSIVFFFASLIVCMWVTQVHAESLNAATSTVTSSSQGIATTTSTTATATTTTKQNQVEIEKRVRDYFADVPVMIQIARCESNFRQFTDNGSPFRGGADGGMVGVFQFNEKIHAVYARARGFDLATLEGNLGYAKYVYEQEGTTPWVSCEPAPSANQDAQTKLKIELMTKLVGLLQELLKLKLATR